jgi:ABC-type lipoprotein release transport system permease subunit
MGETIETAGVAMDALIVAKYAPHRMLFYAMSAVVMTILASVWPAWRVTRMRPVEAIHHL